METKGASSEDPVGDRNSDGASIFDHGDRHDDGTDVPEPAGIRDWWPAFTAASKIEQVVTQAYVALGTTMATYCAQNIGAGKVQRIRSGFRSATIMSFVYAVISGILIMTVGKYMTYLFVSGDVARFMASVDIYLKCVGIFFIPLAVVNLYRNGIQGMGYGILPMIARCGGTCRKRNCRGDRGGKEKLCGRMSGKSDRLDFCGGASDRDVLLYYEA